MAGMEIRPSNAAVLLISGVMVMVLSSALVAAEDVVGLPPLPQETHDFLEGCARKLTPPGCGEQTRLYIYENGEAISDQCCKVLVGIGEECHVKLVEATAPYYTGISQADAKARGLRVWNHCSNVAAAPSN